ncbi:hypothetical protein BCR33DRAFT_719977 [Rhizoclosmatium globosum]|uniref:Heterokaryon incompatibility domain-containing protein n=1 Tax=Rhizoclosmatium globosum TaxID=329046 RepID=A0A1Y2BXM1_9FUNG|nr:hypothetical protein BCR33DRAFT_719977 [Rhizoclosmatium globosum]|eukprot:ORY39501.1 hypothetical protein BCR33DRAFT_719977 [Rhizoclosmatium globosum]
MLAQSPEGFSHAEEFTPFYDQKEAGSRPHWKLEYFPGMSHGNYEPKDVCLELWPISRVASEFASTGILSHVWGSDPKRTMIEGVDVLIRQDDPTKIELLGEIIKSGANDQPRIWVDLLDVDQEDMALKLTQIEQLPELYKSKEHTIIYHSEDPSMLFWKLGDWFWKSGPTEYRIELDYMYDLLSKSEHSTRVWTLQESVLANKVVHVFCTPDPTNVLVAHSKTKSDYLQGRKRLASSQFSMWFLRCGDDLLDLPDKEMLAFYLPSKRTVSKLHDFVNGRAAMYGIKPLSYDAPIKDVFINLVKVNGGLYLHGDLPMDLSGTRAILDTLKENETLWKFLSVSTSNRRMSYVDSHGFNKEMELCRLNVPLVYGWEVVETSTGFALKLNRKAAIFALNEDVLDCLEYIGATSVEWWKPHNQEQRIFLVREVWEGENTSKIAGFNEDGSLEYFSFDRFPVAVPYVAAVDDTLYLIRMMDETQVILGAVASSPEINYYRSIEGKAKPLYERDVLIHLE